LAFCHVSLRTLAPSAKALRKPPRTLADHLRQRRRVLGLTEAQAAGRLGVNLWTVGNWERGRSSPRPSYLPVIHAFLGYCPLPPSSRHLGDRLVAWRLAHGLSKAAAAVRLGLYRGTIARVERGEEVATRVRVALGKFLSSTRGS